MIYNEIKSGDLLLGIRANIDNCMTSGGLHFFGNEKDFIQVALFRYDNGKELKAHNHILRHGYETMKTQEMLFVWRGKIEINIFDEEDKFIFADIMTDGDFYIYYNGGVGYRVLQDDTKMLEVKVGPFEGADVDRRIVRWKK